MIAYDIWAGHEFWEPMEWSHSELLNLQNDLKEGIKPEDSKYFLQFCEEHIWHRLTNLSNMYEELVREWFMPSYLSMLTSFPPTDEDVTENS